MSQNVTNLFEYPKFENEICFDNSLCPELKERFVINVQVYFISNIIYLFYVEKQSRGGVL